MRPLLRRALLPLMIPALSLLLGGCASMKFWDPPYDFPAGTVELKELRRALVCDTPTEQARVRAFDSAAALLADPLGASLQAADLSLPADSSYVVVELGQRRTGGYSLEPRSKAELDETGRLQVQADWIEPAADRMRIQILTSLCVLLQAPAMPYNRVELLDTTGAVRAFWDRSPD